jgi:hypothetical protein
MTTMDDPIVQEVRKAREQLAGGFDFDLHAIFADIRERQKDLGVRLVSRVKTADPNHSANRPPRS